MLLLDTNALIWFSLDDPDLGLEARARIDKALREGDAAFSPVSIWEIALKHAKGKLDLDRPPETLWREALENGFLEFDLTSRIALDAVALTGVGSDPADRFIVATARSRAATLMTSHERILAWPGALARIDARL
jgi:PIN domain nuclease of toxin-antitoxin system